MGWGGVVILNVGFVWGRRAALGGMWWWGGIIKFVRGGGWESYLGVIERAVIEGVAGGWFWRIYVVVGLGLDLGKMMQRVSVYCTRDGSDLLGGRMGRWWEGGKDGRGNTW